MRPSLLRARLRQGKPEDARRAGSVAVAAVRHGVAWGRPSGTAEDIALLAQQGARLIAHGSDFGALMKMLPAFGKTLADGLAAGEG